MLIGRLGVMSPLQAVAPANRTVVAHLSGGTGDSQENALVLDIVGGVDVDYDFSGCALLCNFCDLLV